VKILSLLIFLLSVFPLTIAEAENKHHSWNSNFLEKSEHSNHLLSKRHYGSSRHRGHFRGSNYFFLYADGYHISPYVRYKQPRQKHVVIEKDSQPEVVKKKIVIKTRYIPVEKKPTAILCGGETVYLKNKTTGELIIRYISPATKC
jgi:hypothetical protein